MRHYPSLVKRILIIRPGALGDLIVTLPTFGAIRNYFQHAYIEIMGYTTLLEITKGRFYADAISRFDQADNTILFVHNDQLPPSFIKKFQDVDFIFSFVSDKEQVFTHNLRKTGVKHIIHQEPLPACNENTHITDYLLKSLDSLGITYPNIIPKVFLNNEDLCFGEKFLNDAAIDSSKVLIAIHPGSGSRQKCWPVERFAALMSRLSSNINAQFLVISGPADDKVIEELRLKIGNTFTMVNQLPLPYLAAIVARCRLFIGNDSGVTHLAAATGTPTIAIFGPTDPRMWGPRGEKVKILYKKLPCSPCSPDIRKNCFPLSCLDQIGIESVIKDVYSVLKETT
ncbi:MAG: glycosyltransferase family 9 protein [Planctomycetota bacterium]